MGDDLEKGKQLVIEGFEEMMKLYFPYLKAIEGLRLLGLSDILSSSKAGDDKLIKIGLDSLMGGLKRATTREEIREAIQQNEAFWKMISGQDEETP